MSDHINHNPGRSNAFRQPATKTADAGPKTPPTLIPHVKTVQADGDNPTLGSTGDTHSTNTIFGWLKKLVGLIPSALGANGGIKVSATELNGQSGVVNISDTDTHNGSWNAIQAVGGDVVLVSATETDATGSLDGKTIANGSVVMGKFTVLVRASGGVLRAYNTPT